MENFEIEKSSFVEAMAERCMEISDSVDNVIVSETQKDLAERKFPVHAVMSAPVSVFSGCLLKYILVLKKANDIAGIDYYGPAVNALVVQFNREARKAGLNLMLIKAN